MNNKTKYNIEYFNNHRGGERNYFKIYKEFLYDIVFRLKRCKKAYDKLKLIAFNDDELKLIAFNDDDDDKIYDFDYLIKYYYDKMNDECYSGVMRFCKSDIDKNRDDIWVIKDFNFKFSPNFQESKNNFIIRGLMGDMYMLLLLVKRDIMKYNDEDLISSELIYTDDPNYFEFKKIQPRICQKAKTEVLEGILQNIDKKFKKLKN